MLAFFILIIQCILLWGNFLVYETTLEVLSPSPAHIIALRIIFLILSFSFVAASLLSFRVYNKVSRIFYTLSAIWLGLLWFLVLASIIFWIIIDMSSIDIGSPSARLVGEFLAEIALFVAAYGLFHAQKTSVTEISVAIPNLPSEWRGKRAIQVADFHLGQVRGKTFASRIVKQIQAYKPDLIFITGDVYDGVSVPVQDIVEPFKNLSAPWGVYFATGNHEEFFDSAPYVAALRNVGVEVLMNKVVPRNGVQIAGLTDHDSSHRATLEKALGELNLLKNQPVILLKHEPNYLDIAEGAGVSLVLSGHTHDAQVFPFSYLAKWIFKGFEYGMHFKGEMAVQTTSGVGTWGPPFRVGTKSEIVLLTFENK